MRKPKPSRNKAKDVKTKLVPPITQPPRQQLNNQEALQFLDSIIALAPVSRQRHIQAQQILEQIGEALKRLDAFMLGDAMDKEKE